MRSLRNILRTTTGLLALATLAATPAAADFVINDDLIVDGSACIGFDCVNGESFGFDTIRIKENNLRIKADDTSVAASFPRQDWQITFNDSANGGLSKFSIDAISPSTSTPFTIEAGARSHSLYVDDGGRIGIRTSTPSVELHIIDGDTPALRLQQDGSSGFAPQTWDVAGNETNFFIRDVTNGSQLPFRIRPDAPTSSIFIDTNGDVGLGTSSPDAALHVTRSDESATLLVEETNGTATLRPLITMINNGPPQFQMQNADSGVNWDFRTNNQDDFTINNGGGLGLAFRIDQGTGDVFIAAGQLQVVSSRERKENFTQLDAEQILARVGSLPVTSWSYKRDAGGTRHIGPVAEDFHAAFGVGANERFLSPSDVSGVALAAIQGLQKRMDRIIEGKDARIGELESRLATLEAALGIVP